MISMLVIQSVWDLKYRQIPIAITIVGGIVGIGVSLVMKRPYTDIIMGLLPGIIVLFIGWFTREAIGYGDGFLLCAMGMYLPFEHIVAIVMMASFFAGVIGLMLMAIGRKNGKDQLPFIPFLLVATMLFLIMENGYA